MESRLVISLSRPGGAHGMESFEFVEYEKEDHVVFVRLNRPDSLNALNPGIIEELIVALERAEQSDGVRLVVLSGNGRAFSSGYDISNEEEEQSVEEKLRDPRLHLDTIIDLDIPVIAAVDGYALAGGCNLAIACDLTFASERSEFGYPDMHFGEPPPKLIVPFVSSSLKFARELLYSGKLVPAKEAERMGIVNRVVPADELDDVVEEEVDSILKTPGITVTMVKEMINEVQEAQGYHRGKLDEYLGVLSMETETPKRFREIREEEGLDAALEWMHSANKP